MPVIDVHAHYGYWPFPIRSDSVSHINALCERHDIEKVLLSSAEAITCNLCEGNRKLAEAIYGQERLLGYVVINPNYLEESADEMRKYLNQKKFVGAKFHCSYTAQAINSWRVKELIKAFRRYDKPLLAHTYSAGDAQAVVELCKTFPGLKVIMAHMGGGDWENALKVVEHFPQIFVDPCSSIADRDKVRSAVDTLGERRVLFGSDLTLINPAFVLGMVMEAGLNQRQRELLLYTNAKNLFGL